VRRGREAGHVQADLSDDHRGRGGTDTGNLIQAGHRWGERGDLGLDLRFEVGDVGVQGIDAGEHLASRKRWWSVKYPPNGDRAQLVVLAYETGLVSPGEH
jgi:hypothetical protein